MKNIDEMRNSLISALQFDLNGQNGDVEKVLSGIKKEDISDLWEENTEAIDKTDRTEEYLRKQLVELSYNFSKGKLPGMTL